LTAYNPTATMEQSALTHQPARNYHRLTWEVYVFAGLLVGTADILAAFASFYINTGKNPLTLVSKYIASGVFGTPALKGGAEMIALGLLFHYVISFLFTIFFFWLYKKWRVMSRNWIVTGIVYGVFTWLVMTQLVLPLSNTPGKPDGSIARKLISILILVTMIGLPLSYIAKRVTEKPKLKQHGSLPG
jgi:Na+/proline symporter